MVIIVIIFGIIIIIIESICQGYHRHYVVTSSNEGIRRVGGCSFMLGFGLGDRESDHFLYIFCSAFVVLVIVLSWLVHDSFLSLFHYSFSTFFVPGHFH